MDLEALEKLFAERASQDLAGSAATWGGDLEDDLDGFLAWARETGVLSGEQLAEAYARQPVREVPLGPMPAEAEAEAEADASSLSPIRHTKLGEVGRGNMAEVHVARDETLRRRVAYKQIAPRLAGRARSVERFVTEARITAQLEHPNIVPVYAMETRDGALAYTMKLIDGTTMAERIARSCHARSDGGEVPTDLQLDGLLEVFLKVCDAVAYAHQKGVIHRDLKPENVMVGGYHEVYVMDWGLAKVAGEADLPRVDTGEVGDGSVEGTRHGTIMGTPLYMAPEQARGQLEEVGPHSDQYALGLMLHELVTGAPARFADEPLVTLAWARQGMLHPVRPVSPRDRVRPDLLAIVARATAVESAARYPDVAALAEDVRRYRANEATRARPDSPLQHVLRRISQRREATFVVIVALVALVALLVAAGATRARWDAREAQAQKERVATLLTEVGRQAAALDGHLSSIEGGAAGIAATAGALLGHGVPSDERLYTTDDFQKAETRPPDAEHSAAYRRPISTRHTDTGAAPGVDWAAVEEPVRRLLPLRHEMRRAQIALRVAAGAADAEAADRAWRDEPGPLRWITVGLENGVYMELPGAPWSAEGYDPRVRPWYQAGRDAAGPTWGDPFQEASSGTLMVPCAAPIRDDDGLRIGVTSFLMSFDHMIGRFMEPAHPAIRETYIVDARGRILLRASGRHDRARTTALDEFLDTPAFPYAELAPALAHQREGRVWADAGRTLLVYHPLATTGWSFVVEADTAAVTAPSA